MKHTGVLCLFLCGATISAFSQTIWTPGGTVGNNSANSNVGIGTSAPVYQLDITAGANNGIRVNTSSGQAAVYLSQGGVINGAVRALGGGGTDMQLESGRFLHFLTAGAERMYIDNIGNVGIATTSPTAALQIGTSITNQGFKVGVVGNMANSNAEVRSSLAVLAADASSGCDIAATAWNYYNAGSSPSWSGGILRYYGSSVAGNINGAPAANQAVVLFQNVSNGIIASNGAPIFIAPAGAISMSFPANGNVGIGTTAPAFSLDISGGSTAPTVTRITNSATSFGPELRLVSTGASGRDWRLGSGQTNNSAGLGKFFIYDASAGADRVVIDASGNLGIGTTTPTQKLSVNGTVRAKEVIVDTGWSDYVFDPSYKLKALSEVEAYVKTEKHLPGIPSAQEVADHGVSMGEMQAKLLAKIEELTLHQIEQEKEIKALRAEVAEVHKKDSL
jgi:hypothetical protein